ncbi:ATP-binding protein [Streptomyces lavenduligriseus]|uniref:ATP-binding protein n=1 Tax=Streptomyces lavenduligriseus TaxID=67315 RepID=A0ABT0NPV2_9ACTN|nr:ATP-binding protein [Streptomyces lavenduligriseus]MCL3993323.1 ATP-binding protein [Streptomyces lavenduligriseus]
MSAPEAQVAVTVSVFVQRFSTTRRGARLARRLAAHRLHLWGMPYGGPASDAVTLVVAELAANAVLHGRVPGRDFELRLSFDRAAGVVRVEVSDTHPGRPEPPGPETPCGPPDAEGGRGLLLVAAVAARWGVGERRGPGKTVWAECEVPPADADSGGGPGPRRDRDR